jgi:hypothetical protein
VCSSDLDHQKAVEEAAQLKEQIAKHREEAEVEVVERKLASAAGSHVSGEYVEYALDRFRAHLNQISEEEVEAYGSDTAKVAKWFEDWSKRHGAMSKQPQKQEQTTKKVGVTNGADVDMRDKSKTGQQDARPLGSRSKEELKKLGYSW